jgi:hypothetical protein
MGVIVALLATDTAVAVSKTWLSPSLASRFASWKPQRPWRPYERQKYLSSKVLWIQLTTSNLFLTYFLP